MLDNYIITIARGFGSGGREVAFALSNKLGIPCYSSQILEMASDYSGINEKFFVKNDEKLTGLRLIMKLGSVPNTDRIVEPYDKNLLLIIIFSVFRKKLSVNWQKRSPALLSENVQITFFVILTMCAVFISKLREKPASKGLRIIWVLTKMRQPLRLSVLINTGATTINTTQAVIRGQILPSMI